MRRARCASSLRATTGPRPGRTPARWEAGWWTATRSSCASRWARERARSSPRRALRACSARPDAPAFGLRPSPGGRRLVRPDAPAFGLRPSPGGPRLLRQAAAARPPPASRKTAPSCWFRRLPLASAAPGSSSGPGWTWLGARRFCSGTWSRRAAIAGISCDAAARSPSGAKASRCSTKPGCWTRPMVRCESASAASAPSAHCCSPARSSTGQRCARPSTPRRPVRARRCSSRRARWAQTRRWSGLPPIGWNCCSPRCAHTSRLCAPSSETTPGGSMHLTPRDLDKLLLHGTGFLAQKRLARGLRLNYPEAVALISAQLLELIRDGRSVAELMDMGRRILGRAQVMAGVPELIAEVQVEGTFPDGTKLVTVHHPIAVEHGDLAIALYGSFLPPPGQAAFEPIAAEPIPGGVLAAPGEIELNAGRKSVALRVVNRGDRPIQVGSHYPFAETNRALVFDRGRAYGKRLDIPAGTAVRFEPGETRTVELVDLAGGRVVRGGNALADGPISAEGRSRFMAAVTSQGFGHAEEKP